MPLPTSKFDDLIDFIATNGSLPNDDFNAFLAVAKAARDEAIHEGEAKSKKLVEKLREGLSWEHEAGCSGQFGYRCKCGFHERLLDADYGMSRHPEAADILQRENYRPMTQAEKDAIRAKFRRILGDKDDTGRTGSLSGIKA